MNCFNRTIRKDRDVQALAERDARAMKVLLTLILWILWYDCKVSVKNLNDFIKLFAGRVKDVESNGTWYEEADAALRKAGVEW